MASEDAHRKISQTPFSNTQDFLSTHNGNFLVTKAVVSDYRKQKDFEAATNIQVHSFGIKIKGGESLEKFADNFPQPYVDPMIAIVAAILDASSKRHEWSSGRLETALDKIWVDLNNELAKSDEVVRGPVIDDFLALVESFYDSEHAEYEALVKEAQGRIKPPPEPPQSP